ncbi:MAG: hypothetical protein UT11_C0021G0002 [Berkelbacteria bacterium GW2011_GWA2_38_9]|uniref:Uncharacterized protein n=1 Tax=Berkelbacteria bacterium GW2011_GWA2_38_9 TaxID=1618334 RepID=A0A0G0PK59_9BACT|nr:MAG: hypothetical protein UT11_C0021G0002 [Berkelbacteria bacterium GW2011_GWA2_38_9]
MEEFIALLEERGIPVENVGWAVENRPDEVAAVFTKLESRKVLRRISEGQEISVGPTDGQRTIPGATSTFKAGIDGDFARWKVANKPGAPKGATKVVVDELVEDATFTEMFGSLSAELDALVFEGDQVIDICREHPEWLSKTGWTAFLLKKEKETEEEKDKDKYFVVSVLVCDPGKLRVNVRHLEYAYVWSAKYGRRIVSPQL